MLRKKLSVIAVSLLTVSLAACGADDHAGMDSNTPQTYGTNTYEPGYHGTNTKRTGMADDHSRLKLYNNRQGDGIDHNGPLTEDYVKEPGDLDFGTRRSNNGENIKGNGIDNYGPIKGENPRQDPNLSSFFTSKSSEQYPHTRAILVEKGRYQYVPMEDDGRRWDLNQQGALTNQEQNHAQTNRQQDTADTRQTNQSGAEAQQVIDVTNEYRRQNGLSPLTMDPQLQSIAQMKSNDMQQNRYFSHTSPTYGSPFDMIRDHGVTYSTAGENIAQGQRTAQEVVQAWMNSPGHRKNILNPNYTHIGVGYSQTGNYWTQMFIGK